MSTHHAPHPSQPDIPAGGLQTIPMPNTCPDRSSAPGHALTRWWPSLALCLGLLSACQPGTPPAPVAQLPILQGEQLRYPSGHPQLSMLGVQAAQSATDLVVDLPARLVWNENRTQRIYPAFSGRVSRILTDVGQPVSAGTPLAELASPEFGAAQADTARAQADVQWALRQQQRQQSLFDAGIVARKDLEQAQADAARSQAELERAQARTRLYGSQSGVNQQLSLTSGLNGLVVERNLNPGQELRADQGGPALFVITDPSSLWVQIDAQEKHLPDLQRGAAIELVVPSWPDEHFEARLQAVADFIDPSTRTIKVRAEVANPRRLLKSDMLGTVRLHQHNNSGVVVPASAVQLLGTQHLVFVQMEPGVFEPRKVKVAHEGLSEVLISEGLKAGEQVVKQNSLMLAREFKSAREALEGKPSPGRSAP
jgi:cobalt-zinc-cadmium efflux system membrane fusion protein